MNTRSGTSDFKQYLRSHHGGRVSLVTAYRKRRMPGRFAGDDAVIGRPVAAVLGAVLLLAAAVSRAESDKPPQPLAGYGGALVREGWLPGADGVRLFYRVVGRGSRMVLYVHGGPGTGMREGHDLEPLAGLGHTLVMYDQRGTGYSTLVSDPAQLAIDAHVADLEAVRKHFRLRRLDVIGLSWGAAVVARYAERHPDRVARIVFLSPMSPTRAHLTERLAHLAALRGQTARPEVTASLKESADRWRTAPDAQLPELCRQEWEGFARLYERGGPQARAARGDPCAYPAAVLRNRPVVRLAGIESLGADFDLRPMLRRLRIPALVLEGAQSNVPLEATREWARSLPEARLLLVPDAGHRHWLDQPERVASALRTFLRGSWPREAHRPSHEPATARGAPSS
jgi:proline iminopeptidase